MGLRYMESGPLAVAIAVSRHGEEGIHYSGIVREMDGKTSKGTTVRHLKRLLEGGILERSVRLGSVHSRPGVTRVDRLHFYSVAERHVPFIEACDELIEYAACKT